MNKLALSFVAAVASFVALAQETAPQDQPPEWFVKQSEMSGKRHLASLVLRQKHILC